MNKWILCFILFAGLVFSITLFKCSKSEIVGEDIIYTADGVSMRGYLAYDLLETKRRPGVIIVHEWWGLNDYIRKRAEMIARLGYTAMAIDMYGNGKKTMDPEEAKKLSGSIINNFSIEKNRFLAGFNLLKNHWSVQPRKIAAVGYCFGGKVVLDMARLGTDLKAVVSFHGILAPAVRAKPGQIKARILVLNGEDDKFVPKEQVEAFKKEMKLAGADLTFINYPGAIHAFTNPEATKYGQEFNLPLAYNAKADKKSWKEMKRFLESVFK